MDAGINFLLDSYSFRIFPVSASIKTKALYFSGSFVLFFENEKLVKTKIEEKHRKKILIFWKEFFFENFQN